MSLTASQLFTPAPSGVNAGTSSLQVQSGSWFELLLATAQTLNLPTTSWQPGAPERTIMEMSAVALSQTDLIISQMAQGGFLDFAASGTISFVDINGNTVLRPVTPDPSIPSQNPTGALGWLDALGQSFYNVYRLLATYATGELSVANTGITTLNYGPTAYHAGNTTTGATYSNVDTIAIPPSAIAGTGGVITGVVVSVSTTTITTQSAHGLAINDVVYFANVNGVTGLNGVFAVVTTVPTTTTFTINVGTSGTWTSGGQVYLCTEVNMAADVVGVASNASPSAVTSTITAVPGVFINNLTAWSATNYENNVSYAARCRLKLAALSPNGPKAAYEYYALSAQGILADQTPPVMLTNGAIATSTTFSNPQTGVVSVLLASSTPDSVVLGEPVTPGCAQLAVTAATNVSPIAITTAFNHNLSTDDAVVISGILGNTAANGAFTITVIGLNSFTLNGSTGNGAYTSGGIVEGGDLGQIDNIIQDNVVPDCVTALTQSALAFPVLIVATVAVPQAYVGTYVTSATTALQTLFATFPIGGNIPPGESAGTIPLSIVEGALVEAGVLTFGAASYVRSVTNVTINGVADDATYPAPEYYAILLTPTITVVGV